MNIIHAILHIDTTLLTIVAHYGALTYAILFIVIFSETGLIITPFLPGDALLFVAGSIAAHQHSALNIQVLMVILIIAAALGNKTNYLIGRFIGEHLFTSNQAWLFNKNYLLITRQFYEKHGGKTLLLARFIPIIRTFAPFVAGMSKMPIVRFSLYNASSAVIWIGTLVGAGYCLGAQSFIQHHLSLVIYGIIGLSISPILFSVFFRLRTKYRYGYAKN